MISNVAKVLGEQVRRLRIAAGLSPDGLGRLAGLSAEDIANFESANGIVRIGDLFDIAGALGVSVASLFATDPVDPGSRSADEPRRVAKRADTRRAPPGGAMVAVTDLSLLSAGLQAACLRRPEV
jgi:transcriptional regulator with XRE-family HTH domain